MTKTQRKRYYETSPGVFSPMHTAEQADAHKLARAEGDGQVSNETARAYLNAFPADKTAEGIHALAIVRGLRERNRELEKLAREAESLRQDLRDCSAIARKALKGRALPHEEDDFTEAPTTCLIAEMADEIAELRLALMASKMTPPNALDELHGRSP